MTISARLITLELNHSEWAAPIYKVFRDPLEFIAAVDAGEVEFQPGADGSREASDKDSGRVSRSVVIEDVSGVFLSGLRAIKGSTEQVQAIIREFDLDTEAFIEGSERRYTVGVVTFSPPVASFDLVGRNPSRLESPDIRFTSATDPALR